MLGLYMQVDSVAPHLMLLLESYCRLTGRQLLGAKPPGLEQLVAVLDSVPFALVSHGTEADPVFNYGNKAALDLFGMDWKIFTSLPSRYSAEQPNREARERLLHEVKCHGYIDNYSGVRIASDGRRFMIERATVWNVVDGEGLYHGQAATFAEWHFL